MHVSLYEERVWREGQGEAIKCIELSAGEGKSLFSKIYTFLCARRLLRKKDRSEMTRRGKFSWVKYSAAARNRVKKNGLEIFNEIKSNQKWQVGFSRPTFLLIPDTTAQLARGNLESSSFFLSFFIVKLSTFSWRCSHLQSHCYDGCLCVYLLSICLSLSLSWTCVKIFTSCLYSIIRNTKSKGVSNANSLYSLPAICPWQQTSLAKSEDDDDNNNTITTTT